MKRRSSSLATHSPPGNKTVIVQDQMSRTNILHCSYHKCLTTYYVRVMDATYNKWLRWSRGYRHFNSRIEDFYEHLGTLRIASVNNHRLDFERLGDFRLSRFIRDPRDLVVSGYFYHKRGAEDWTRIAGPRQQDWAEVNGIAPAGMASQDESFSDYLQSLPEEDGLVAEIEFRERHFKSMGQWPEEHPNVLTYRYEEILGHEEQVFAELFEFYGLAAIERRLGMHFVRKFSARNRSKTDRHIRNPNPNQWRKYFTPKVKRCFNQRHGDLLKQLGYPSD